MKRKHQIIVLIVLTGLLICSLLSFAAFRHYGQVLESQEIAKIWRGDSEERFAQASAFFPVGALFTETDVRTFHGKVDAALLEASLEAPKGGSLWRDAYSAPGKLTVRTAKGASAEVKAIGIGGDFFLFHRLQLISGGYIGGDDLMKDRVVLDRDLAWRLFGAVEVAGLEVLIGDKTYIVAGVVDREDDFATEKAYQDGTGIFVHLETLNTDPEKPAQISWYEIVMADPISGFVEKTVSENLKAFEPTVVQNTGRYGVERSFSVLKDFGSRAMDTSGAVFPYWENAARLVESYTALYLLAAMVFGLLPFLSACVVAIAYLRRLNRRFKAKIPVWKEQFGDKMYDRRAAKKERKEQRSLE